MRVLRVWCADDVGKAINPDLVRGQIEGAIVQAQGYAITENFQTKDGQVLTPYLSNYLIPTVLDVPPADRFDHPGIPGSDRAVGGARHGRDALSALCACRVRRGERRDRHLVRFISADTGESVKASRALKTEPNRSGE